MQWEHDFKKNTLEWMGKWKRRQMSSINFRHVVDIKTLTQHSACYTKLSSTYLVDSNLWSFFFLISGLMGSCISKVSIRWMPSFRCCFFLFIFFREMFGAPFQHVSSIKLPSKSRNFEHFIQCMYLLLITLNVIDIIDAMNVF